MCGEAGWVKEDDVGVVGVDQRQKEGSSEVDRVKRKILVQ